MKKCKYLSLILFLTFLTSSCVYLRLFKLKRQMEDFETNFSISLKDNLVLHFKKPVLLDKDVLWLASTNPDQTKNIGQKTVWTYILEKRYEGYKNERKNFDITTNLFFKNHKLIALALPERFTDSFSRSFLKNILLSLGKADINKVDKVAKTTIYESKDYRLPKTKDIEAVLGKPYRIKNENREKIYIYKYFITAQKENKRPRLTITYVFDTKTEKLRSLQSNIKGMKIVIDFEKITGK